MAITTIQRAGGFARSASMTPEQRTACAKKAAAARWGNSNAATPSHLQGKKCALCRRSYGVHEPSTHQCPAQNGDGWDLLNTFLADYLVPKSKPGLVQAYALALASIADMQAEKMNWRDWDTDPPKPGRLVTLHTGGKVNDFTGRVMDDGARIQVVQDNAIVWAVKGTKWYALPEYPKP